MATTRHLSITDTAALRLAADTVQHGGIIAFSGETSYLMACGVHYRPPLTQLDTLTGHNTGPELHRQFPVLLASAAQLSSVVATVPERTWLLIDAFWPGQLSIILPAHDSVPPLITGESQNIVVRVPAAQPTLRLLETISTPLAISTARRRDGRLAQTADDVIQSIEHGVDLVLEGGPPLTGHMSTIIDMTGSNPIIRRRGAIAPAIIATILGQNPLLA